MHRIIEPIGVSIDSSIDLDIYALNLGYIFFFILSGRDSV